MTEPVTESAIKHRTSDPKLDNSKQDSSISEITKFTFKTYLNGIDLWILTGILVAISSIFIIPALLNRAIMPGDDVIQNFPLRIFSAELIRSGHLPLWNPYSFSGTPLLAGFNSGSLYPASLLFVIMPPITAWVTNEIIAYFVAATGIYILLRCYRYSILASTVSTVCYVGSGSLAVQVAHIDLIQAMSIVPWTLIILGSVCLKLNRPNQQNIPNQNLKSILGETILLSICFALIFLTGSTRAVTDSFIILLVFLLYILFSNCTSDDRMFISGVLRNTKRQLVIMFILSLSIGLLLSSLQDGSGLIFIYNSQRSSASIGLFNQSSPYPGWISMLFVPGILGTSHSLNSPGFFASSITNIVEVSGYIGLIATLGFFEYSLKNRKYKDSYRHLVPFFYVGLVGLFLTYIAGNLFGGIMIHIPIYGSQRIQGRNLLEVDFAFTFFLAFMIEQIINHKSKLSVAKYLCLGTIALCLLGLIDPIKVTEIVGTSVTPYSSADNLRPWFAAQLCVDILIFLVITRGHKASNIRLKTLLICTAVVLDIALFNLTSVVTIATGNSGSSTVESNFIAVLDNAKFSQSTNALSIKRFVLYNPYLNSVDQLVKVNWPDINVVTQQFSAQGYQSLSLANYDSITQTHGNSIFNPQDLNDGIFKFLDVTKAYSAPSYFYGYFRNSINTYQIPNYSDTPSSWYFGKPILFSTFQVNVTKCSDPKAYLINPDDKLFKVSSSDVYCLNNLLTVRYANNKNYYVGILLKGTYGSNHITDIPPVFFATTSFTQHILSGILANQLYFPIWKYRSTINGIALFTETANGFITSYASASKISSADLNSDGNLNFNINAKRQTVVTIDQTYSEGFTAKATSLVNHKTHSLQIIANQPIQEIVVPKGNWHITVNYMPRYISEYIYDDIFGIAILLLMVIIYLQNKIRTSA
jgi:hypothetical protein